MSQSCCYALARFLRLGQSWIKQNLMDLKTQWHIAYVPPLMIYLAAGLSGLTGIVNTFFVKDYLNLSAEFMAVLGFWVMLPWTLKMPVGHLVDLWWPYKNRLVYLGSFLIGISLLIMLNLLEDQAYMNAIMSSESWFILAALIAPVGYVIQDTIADAMTVEAVPHKDKYGHPLTKQERVLAHTSMQTLGRVAVIGGALLVAWANMQFFSDIEISSYDRPPSVYIRIYHWALWIPVISISGVLLARYLRHCEFIRLAAQGYETEEINLMLDQFVSAPAQLNPWFLGSGLSFTLFAIVMGLSDLSHKEEIVFLGSLGIILYMIQLLTIELSQSARRQLYGIALVIFMFRAVPVAGVGETWWMIDELGFNPAFIAKLSLLTSFMTLVGMLAFRRMMAERSITSIIAFLTLALTVLYLPNIGLFYGLHVWTAAHTGGIVDAQFIVLFDTALESPLGQVAMIPMLAWIAHSAPEKLKATYFAVMSTFVNLALSLSQLMTQFLNQHWAITRAVKDPNTGELLIPADYSELGGLLFWVALLSFILPFSALWFCQKTGLRSSNYS